MKSSLMILMDSVKRQKELSKEKSNNFFFYFVYSPKKRWFWKKLPEVNVTLEKCDYSEVIKLLDKYEIYIQPEFKDEKDVYIKFIKRPFKINYLKKYGG